MAEGFRSDAVVRHVLPGDAGDTSWLERLNDFGKQETLRQVAFKGTHWPDMPDGCRGTRPAHFYPHILPDGQLAKAFFPPISGEVLRYCRCNDVAIHTEALNLRSSQVACFNVMFPLRQDLSLAARALDPVLPDVSSVERTEFEYTGPDEATEWLGEPRGGRRGQNRTSIDIAIWWSDGTRRLLTLVEWKYTESGYGTCGGYRSRGNPDKRRCENLNVLDPAAPTKCYLTEGRNRRRYWEHLKCAGIDLGVASEAVGCPFRGPFYQLMRQQLLAQFLREWEDVHQVFVVSLGFRGNTELLRSPGMLRPLGANALAAWNRLLRGVPRIRHVTVEEIVEAARAHGSPSNADWLHYLNERYGL